MFIHLDSLGLMWRDCCASKHSDVHLRRSSRLCKSDFNDVHTVEQKKWLNLDPRVFGCVFCCLFCDYIKKNLIQGGKKKTNRFGNDGVKKNMIWQVALWHPTGAVGEHPAAKFILVPPPREFSGFSLLLFSSLLQDTGTESCALTFKVKHVLN